MGSRRGALASILAALAVAACAGGSPSTPSAAVVVPSPSSPASSLPSDQPSASAAQPTDPPTPAPVDPCSLITRAEANAVTGTKPGDPMPAGNPPVHCTWPTPTSGAVGQVEIEVGDGAKKAYDIDHDVLHHAFTPVPGVGDEAYSESGAVFFRVGATWVEVSVVRLDDPAGWMPQLIALAKTVAGRL